MYAYKWDVTTTEHFTDLGKLNFLTEVRSVLGSSQFLILPQVPPKIILNSKVVKIDIKLILLLCKSKSVTHSLVLV